MKSTMMVGLLTCGLTLQGCGLDKVKVLIGGAPITQDFADEIGADGFAPDAGTAVDVARSIVTAG